MQKVKNPEKSQRQYSWDILPMIFCENISNLFFFEAKFELEDFSARYHALVRVW